MNLSTPQDFGAVGNGVVDDTIAMQAWADSGHDLYLPASTYLITSSLWLKSAKTIRGSGQLSVILCNPTVVSSPGVLVRWTTQPQTWQHLSMFTVRCTNGKMGDAMQVDSSGASSQNNYLSNISSLQLEGCLGRGLNIICGANNGFFNSKIEFNYIVGGIKLDKAGDSIVIRGNTILGANNGVEINPMTQGSSNISISENNITNNGYSIFVGASSANIHISDNQCERIASGQPIAICVVGTASAPTNNIRIIGNNINGHSNASFCLIYTEYANSTFIDENVFTSAIGIPACYIGVGSNYTRVGGGNLKGSLPWSDHGNNTKFLA